MRKFTAALTAIALVFQGLLPVPAVHAAATLSWNVQYFSPAVPPSPPRMNPGSNVIVRFVGAVSGLETSVSNPEVAFRATQPEYSFVSSGSGYVSIWGVPTYYSSSAMNPPSSATGTVLASLPVGSSQFGFSGATFSIPQSYPHKTFDYAVTYSVPWISPVTISRSVAVNVVPHIRSVSFSKSSIISNGIDNATLSVQVLDRNGCSDVASVSANLSELWGSSTESLSFSSCAWDGVTATYVSSPIFTTAAPGTKTVTVTAYDVNGNANASDALFASDDLASSAAVTVNSPTAPVVTVTPISPSVVAWGVNSSVTWQSSQTGSYRIYVGPSAACGSWTPLATGTVATADSNIVTPIPSAALSEGSNQVLVCVENVEPTEGSAFSTVTKDSVSPTVSPLGHTNNIVSQDVSVSVTANEAGTYRAYVNGSYAGIIGTYDTPGVAKQFVVPNSAFTVDPGNNALYVTVTDAVGNVGYSPESSVYKDGLPPDPVSSVSLEDCDYVGNSSTACANLGNPRNGTSGRDFRISWTPVLESAALTFDAYEVYVLPEGQPLSSSGVAAVKTIFVSTASGTLLDDGRTTDSLGTPFHSTGSVNYVAYVKVRKSNGLSSLETASPPVSITADAITYPSFVSARFVSNTGVSLEYSKPLSSTLSHYDASKFFSDSGCFIVDASSWTGAVSVSWSSVTFRVEPLGNTAKSCSDAAILPGLVRDFEGLGDEDVRTGLSVSDGQAPTISLISPVSGAFISGAGNFTLLYTLSESMSGTSLSARFTDGSGSVVEHPLSAHSTAGTKNVPVSGSMVGLSDGKTYSLAIVGEDLSGNASSSNLVSSVRYDVSPPSVPSLSFPANGAYLNVATPSLSWAGSTDNASQSEGILYEIQVSLAVDFSSMFAFGTASSGSTSFTLSPAAVTNTGYYWRVRSSDEAGNLSAWSSVRGFIFDSFAPSFSDSSAWNVTRSFASRVKNGDVLRISSIVSDNLPNTLFSPGISADFSSAGGSASSVPDSFSLGIALWERTVSCSDGNRNVAVSASDLAGNSSSVEVPFICDNAPPSVNGSTITAPAPGSFLSGGSEISVEWNPSFYASEISPVSNPITVEYSSDGNSWTPIASLVANSGNVAWTVPFDNSPTAKIRLTAVDQLGNFASGSVAFTVDSTNPSVASDALVFPNGGEYLKGSTGTGILIEWNPSKISDAHLADSPISLSYSLNSGTDWTPIASGLANSGTYLWNVWNVDSQSALIRISAVDKAGRVSFDVSDSVFSIDSTLPDLNVAFPPTPETDSFVSGSGFDLGVSGFDANLQKVSYRFSDGAFSWNESSSGWIGGESWNDLCVSSPECANYAGTIFPNVTDSVEYSLVFRAVDRAGNVRESSSVRLWGDLSAPSVSHSLFEWRAFSGAVSLLGTTSDLGSGISSVKVSIRRIADGKYWDGIDFLADSETLLASSTSDAYAHWNYDGFTMPAGDPEWSSYLVTILWVDKAYKFNNETRTGATIFKDSQGPTIAADVWTTPSAGEFWNGSTTKTLQWNPSKITDAISGVNQVSGISIEYATGAGTWHQIVDSETNDGEFDWNVPLIDADVTFRIFARDLLWNLSTGRVSPSVVVDSLPPEIQSVETMDRSASGKIDGLFVTMSEPIRCSTVVPSDFTVSSVGTPSAVSACSGNSSSFVLEFAPHGDTASTPSLTVNPGTSLADRAGNFLAPVTRSSVDKSVPRLLSASLSDFNDNGKIDRVIATFSEPLSSASDVSAWSLAGVPSGMGTAPLSASVSGTGVTLAFSEPSAFETSSSGVTLSFVSNPSWKDAADNVAASRSSVVLTDFAAPRLVSAVAGESAGNYVLDVAFSEVLDSADLAGFSIVGADSYSGTVLQTGVKTYRFVTGDSSLSDTARPYAYAYVPGTVADFSGNPLAAIGQTAFADGVAPKILSRKTVDADGDGKIDAVFLTLSETLDSNVSGLSATVSGYSVSGYSSSGSGVTISLVERAVSDTDAAPSVRVTNASLSDLSGNLFPSEGSAVPATDSVGPVIVAARYDGNKIVATLSEPFSGSPSASWFSFSGTSVTALSADGSGIEIEIPVSGSVVYGTTEISLAASAVEDVLGNAQTSERFVKISASVVINEVMWSSTGSSNTQYVELRNLWPDEIDLSWFRIENAASGGTDVFVIPAGKTVAGGGIFLISAALPSDSGNLLSDSVSPDVVDAALSLSPSQTENLVLTNAFGSTYDRASANPFPAGNDALAVSMERKPTPGDGLSSANWYDARTGSGFFDSSIPKGTPGAQNVFDAAAPTTVLVSPSEASIFWTGTAVTVEYSHSDDVLMPESPSRSFVLEKNDGSGNYSDVTGVSVLSSTGNASVTSYALQNLARGAYRATFGVSDAAGNVSQTVSNFYVDALEFDVSTSVADFGSVDAGTLAESSTVAVTVKTVGAPFSLRIGGNGKLQSADDEIAAWDGSLGFGYACESSPSSLGTCDSQTAPFGSGTVIHASAASPDSNGNLKTFSYEIVFAARFDELTKAGSYVNSTEIGITASY